ncbi:MAG TPA: MG2 domain-containing protein, partial [Anaeromyxobacteraceae bacterium]|nr:MG2 domain-containing protein [Anaeromyxobacteraceae bacterium]
GPAGAKPLYLTVSRTYATGERPVVDVAFERRGPVELRILRPDSLDAFLAKQANLRRAYQAPDSKENPGRFLARGLNAMRLPGTFLYRALGEDFRRDVAPALPGRSQTPPSGRPLAHLAEGPERLVGLPPGTTLVRRTWLNLDLGGAGRDYSVPGFDPFGQGSGWEERRVELDPLPGGLYVVQLVQGRVEGQVVLVVTDLRVQVKQTDGEVLVRVAGKDLAPVAGADVVVRSAAGAGRAARTDARGEARLRAAEPRLLVVVRAGADVAVVDTDFYSTLAASPDVFVYTDRPIYRPGDQVQFRGVVRQPDAFLARLFTPRSRDVSVALAVAEGREVKARARVDEFGAFSGALLVPDDVGTGVLRLTARLDDRPHEAEARVQEYVKPTFYLEVLGEAETVRPGETLRAKVRARRYAGGAPERTRWEVFLHRTLLDSPTWVDDAGLGAQGSAVTYGSPSTTEGRLSVPERLHSSIEARGQQYAEDPWASAPLLDANGEAEISVPVPPLAQGDERFPWRYTLSVRARDDQGTFANGSRPYFLAASEVLGTVRPGAVVALAGGETSIAVRSARLSGSPFPEARGSVEFVLRTASGDEKKVGSASFTTGPDGVWRGKMPAPDAGTVIARVTLKDGQGRPWTGEGSLLVVKAGAESVRVPALQLASRGLPVAPGEEAELVALLPAGWGPGGKDRGRLWVTLSGTGLFETRLVEANGLSLVHRFPVERRFGSAVYASVAYPTAAGRWEERTVPFRIVPPERVLAVSVSPERPEAEPLGPQTLALRVTDHLGRGVRAQVSVGVVDKAIYALQGEFRPRILDFFYPLVRDNVATFTSAEFQGYGYGEALARALARPGHAFAAVKPPTRTREVDTAYWNPAIVTDEDGRATVTFALPTNQTLWTVTAVAVDASGRFGEGTGEFASRGGTLVVASLPRFLRAGDRAVGSVRVARGEKGGEEKLALAVAVEGGVTGAGASESLSLAARAERVVPVSLEASGPAAGLVLVSLSGGDRALRDRREVVVRPAAIEETLEAAGFGGGRLALDVPPGATVESVELSLRPSTVALALAQVEDLLTYPYGCLEQLVATTIPNVALHRVLEVTGAAGALDPPARALLAEARSRAVQGTDRILALARPGGGFTWFAGGYAPSVPLTLIALDGLSHAIEAGLVARDDPRVIESARWLEGQEGLPLPLEATRAYVLARLDGPRQAARVRSLLDRLAAAPPSDLHPVALAALAAERAGILGEPAVKERVADASARSREALARPADLRLDPDAYFAYPLRRAGLTAILAHAASLSQVDLAVTRRRLAEALSEPGALSTFERSTAILHSLWLIERDAREMKAASPPAVKVDGGEAPRLAPRGAGLSASLARTTRAVTVASFDGQAVLRARVHLPLSQVQARAEGMSVDRAYWRLLPGGQRRRLGPGEAVAQGEEVFVELRIDAHEGEPWRSLRSAYYVLEDPVPAGFSPLAEDKEYRGEPYGLPIAHEALKRRSLSPERALFFFEEPAPWSRSPRVVGYVLRATFPGTFAAPPASVEDMYAPRVRGRSAPAALEIRPSAASAR